MRVLFAEDDRVAARLLSELLKSWNYDAQSVQNGRAALQAYVADPTIQIVLLDWELPEMDGPDVCRGIRKAGAERPTYVILLTSRSKQTDVIEGLEAGADDYLIKPYDPKELRARIHTGVRVVELQQRLADKVAELERALADVRTLRGLVPICAYCKSVRDDTNYWQQVEHYLAQHTELEFSHGVCPRCMPKAREDFGLPEK